MRGRATAHFFGAWNFWHRPVFPFGNSSVHAKKQVCMQGESIMSSDPGTPSAHPPAPRLKQKGGIGLFQLLGFGLLFLFVVILLVVLVRGLIASD
jgi:hypothetical protein